MLSQHADNMIRIGRNTSFAPSGARGALFLLASIALSGGALAGDVGPPKPPAGDDLHCSALGEGFFPVAGSNACIRISGYVAAGADLGGALHPVARGAAPFEPSSTPTLRTGAGVAADARFDTPMGPGRIYVQVGHDNFGP
jgi:Porin subfamily